MVKPEGEASAHIRSLSLWTILVLKGLNYVVEFLPSLVIIGLIYGISRNILNFPLITSWTKYVVQYKYSRIRDVKQNFSFFFLLTVNFSSGMTVRETNDI